MHPVQAKAKQRRNWLRRRRQIHAAYFAGKMPAGRTLKLLCGVVRHGRRWASLVPEMMP